MPYPFSSACSPAHPSLRASVAAALLILLSAACNKSPEGGHAGMGGPVPVTAITAQAETLPLTLEYAAQTLGSREVEVRARVTGILLKRNYVEGAKVKSGQSLFTIDPAPFEASVARAEADTASAEARLEQAQREAARLKPLLEHQAVSRKEYDDAASSLSINRADLMGAKARLREAKLNLEWTRVQAPQHGISGRALKSEGSLVSGPDVLLTTVTQIDPIQVIFGIPDNERLQLLQDVSAGRLQWPKDSRFKVTLKLADGSVFNQSGFTDFLDMRVSRETGTREARGELPNPDGQLLPGQFVRAILTGAQRIGVFRVPQRAVLEGPQGKFVYIVGKEGKAEQRPVDTGEWMNGDVVVFKGLSSGEQVIVDGVVKLGPGAPVQVSPPAAASAAPASPAGTPGADGKQGG